MVFEMRNSLEYVKIHESDQKPFFRPFFGQKWPKMAKNLKILAYFFFSDFDKIGVYLYVFWDYKFIGIH